MDIELQYSIWIERSTTSEASTQHHYIIQHQHHLRLCPDSDQRQKNQVSVA